MLEEAHALTRRNDDRVVAHYWRLIDKLAAFPPERRAAGEGHLQFYLEEALFGAQAYLAKRGRYNEAQALFVDRIDDLLGGDTLSDWQLNRAKLLSWAGHIEEAFALVMAEINETPLNIPARWFLFDLLAEAGRLDEAEASIEDLNSAVEAASVADPGADLSIHSALVCYLGSALAIERGDWATAFAQFQESARRSDAYDDNWRMLYSPLVLTGEVDLANRALNREKSEASQRFWRGLNGFYNGDERGAKVEWQQVTKIEIGEVWVRSAADWILAHYYLGDEQRLGLEMALRLLNRPQHEPEPIMLMLAALGWALRGDWPSVRTNLEFSLARYRENLQDVQLPEIYWPIARDLIGEANFAEFAGYFKRPRYLKSLR